MSGWRVPRSFPPCDFLRRPDRAIARSIARAARRGRYRGVVLTVNATDTRWWGVLARAATTMCLVHHRPLVRDTGERDLFGPRETRAGQALGTIALGYGDPATFAHVWRPRGSIWRRPRAAEALVEAPEVALPSVEGRAAEFLALGVCNRPK